MWLIGTKMFIIACVCESRELSMTTGTVFEIYFVYFTNYLLDSK